MIALLTAFALSHFDASPGWWIVFVLFLFMDPYMSKK